MSINWNALTRPQSVAIKRYLSQLLVERYPQHDELVDRISTALVTKSDVEGFGKLIADVYEIAYLKCINDHKEAMERSGYKVIIKQGFPSAEPIFKDQT